MELKKLIESFNKLGLSVMLEPDGKTHSITPKGIANRMLFFDASLPPEEYTGGIIFKSINTTLFSGDQIKKSLELVDDFLHTPVSERKLF